MLRLTPDELAELEERIRAGGPDGVKARDALAVAFRPLAYGVGFRVAYRAGRPEHVEDLVQEAWMGVLAVARRYDPERYLFVTCAVKGAHRWAWRWIREHGHGLTGRTQHSTRCIAEATELLRGALGREPTMQEIAAHIGWPVSTVLAYNGRAVPLDDAFGVADSAELPDEQAESAQVTERVQKAVNGLRPKRREVLLMRLSCDEPNLPAIAEQLGITRQAAHVRHTAALEDLRAVL